ncbi:Acetyl esterase/lipase [Pseudonocardia thermophila]|jgi:Esterase/lipase|uniref:Acetyl esterase/lipase n=2 Tax=Pseudonocardia thermophila TaxID=1848 RepID=A0A1M6X784_PSETH|nr:Acetyl esterase/lipase [Pseudonocardia thermophila]
MQVARAVTRFVVAPVLDPRLPVAVRRRLLDATGFALPSPRGTRRRRTSLGGVPADRVTVAGGDGPHQVLFLHGGGYSLGSARTYRAFAAHLARATGAPVHVPEYRLAPEHPHPAAVDDAHAAYRALRAVGHEPQRIAVAGDSAGGGLALSLLLRLRAEGADLPGSVALISPWLDLDLSSPTLEANRRTDVLLSRHWLEQAAAGYRAGADPADLRPLQADLTGLPPIHLLAATGEILLGDADALAARLAAAGAPHTYDRVPGLWHDFVLYTGAMAEADAAVARLGAAVRADCLGERRA